MKFTLFTQRAFSCWSGAMRLVVPAALYLLFVFTWECSAQTNVSVNGTGTGKNWGTSTTWTSGMTFSSNGSIGIITYGNNASSSIGTVNNLNNMTVAGITVNSTRAGASTISGNGFILNGNVTNSSSAAAANLQIGTLASPLTGNLTLNRTITFNASNTAAAVAIQLYTNINALNSAGFIKAGSGNMSINGNITVNSVDIQGGTLSTVTGLGFTGSSTALSLSGGTLNIGTISQSFASLDGTGGSVAVGTGAILTVSGAVDSSFSGVISGAGSLTKSGTGQLTLAGTNTYSGATAVDAGTLMVTGTLSTTSGVSVNNGGTLAGTGTIGALTTLNSGSTLSPGNGVGTINLTGGLTVNSGGAISMTMSNSTSFDTVNLGSAAFNLNGNGTLTITINNNLINGDYALFSKASTGNFNSVVLAGGIYSGTMNSGNSFSITSNGLGFSFSGGNLTVIPEPSTWALMSFGAAFVLWRIRRRKAPQR